MRAANWPLGSKSAGMTSGASTSPANSPVIDQSWARETQIPPYHIYVKIAYHLCQDAREGLVQFRIPKNFGAKLFAFQIAAVQLAARHVTRRGGVLLATLSASAKR
jgi:hypothetical protein